MIRFLNKDNKVNIQVETPEVVTKYSILTTEFTTGTELNAELLARHLDNGFHKGLEEIRKDAYEAGYKAGRGKKTKTTWFARTWGYRFKD